MIEPKTLDYIPSAISFAAGFLGPMGDVGFFMVADIKKAHEIIHALIAEGRDVHEATMGLNGDWRENSCIVYDGVFQEYTCYNSSQWAEPIMIVEFNDGKPSEAYPVWKREEKPVKQLS